MHKQINTVAPPKVWTSKTYLMIMDANGKNKKVVGEVPEEVLNCGKNIFIDDIWGNKKIVGVGCNSVFDPTIWVFDIETKISKVLSVGRNPIWATDGQKIYFEKLRIERIPDKGLFEKSLGIYGIDIDGTNEIAFKGELPKKISVNKPEELSNMYQTHFRTKESKSYLFMPFWWRV